MPLALPLRVLALLHVGRLSFGTPRPRTANRGRLDLCALPRHLRRDIGFGSFACETHEDWRNFP